MNDLPDLTVSKHHLLCVGTLAMCYAFVPVNLQKAIYEAVDSARKMGMPVNPDNLAKGLPLSVNAGN